jgi:hypothetical protein
LYDGVIGGYAFKNETRLNFSQRSMTIFIQTDKPIYKQSEIGVYNIYIVYFDVIASTYFSKLKNFITLVYFRAIPINTELKAFDSAVDVYILDPNRHIMRRWLSRQVCI